MKTYFALLLLIFCVFPVLADGSPTAPITVNVWPGMAPGETTANTGVVKPNTGEFVQITDVTAPTLLIFRPDNQANHPAVLVFPGGGYGILSKTLEGTEIAQWLNTQGYVAAVLLYRVPNNRPGAFQDAQRALSLLRAHATHYGVDPSHIGVIGFSAGGHLAAVLSSGYSVRSYPIVDEVDSVSCRPDFTLLIYPAYLADKTGGVAPEVLPHTGMPPVFVAQTRQDPFFSMLPYTNMLQTTGIPMESLVYDGGGHGYGLHAKPSQPVSHWPDEAATWIATQVATPANK